MHAMIRHQNLVHIMLAYTEGAHAIAHHRYAIFQRYAMEASRGTQTRELGKIPASCPLFRKITTVAERWENCEQMSPLKKQNAL
jgi:hypothetical protein